MFPQDFAFVGERERQSWLESPGVRYRREWHKHREIDQLKERLSQARQSLKVATAQ